MPVPDMGPDTGPNPLDEASRDLPPALATRARVKKRARKEMDTTKENVAVSLALLTNN